MSTLRRMADHDANEERRYLIEGKRFYLTWSWIWLAPMLGVGANYDPYAAPNWNGNEVASVWLHLGPLTVEAYWTRVPSPAGGDS